ncbi:MAG: hypothetical protein R3F62_06085 [Planctomycetota bacterium]
MSHAPRAISVRGARERNLHGLDLELPLGRWTAVTGPSGSGKTSLVFDTLVREGQVRFLGALSPRARQFLGKLGRADAEAVRGLPAPVAIGNRTLSPHPRSTVGTRSGLLDLLRLLFARAAEDPQGEPLSLACFSFNRPEGACPACAGLGVEDEVDPALLVQDPTRSIRDGALAPTLKNGYTVYSQVTLEVMDRICRAHGFDVDTPWERLSDAQREVILYGTQALKVPFGKHSLESRLRWEGITARPREEGYYRGLIPVIEETLGRNRNPNVLRYVRSVPCQACAGTRLGRVGREARLGGRTLVELAALPARALAPALAALPASPVWEALRPSVELRLERMLELGLGHLSLARESTSLSGGEGQRLGLVAQLGADLSGQLIAMDEPTLGLYPGEQAGLRAVFEAFRAQGNTLVVVEHDPDFVRHAEHLVALGPGAGPEGGRITHAGPPPPDPLGTPPAPRAPRTGQGALTLRGATLHGLQQAELTVELGVLTVVLGPSGAGKSSLVFGTLLPALQGRAGGAYAALEGAPPDLVVRALDASPLGRTPRSTPATWTGAFDLIRKRFADTPEAKARGWGASRFSYNTAAGRCATCEGLGVERLTLHLLQDVERTCSACGGGRYAPETLEVRLDGRSVADVLRLTAKQALAAFAEDPPIAATCQALCDLGLEHLALGQSSTSLSRGEAQRVKLATLVASCGRGQGSPELVLLDEPDRGLHPLDVARLVAALDALVAAGHTVLAISHHRHLWAAADRRVRLEAGVATRETGPLALAPLSQVAAPRPAARGPAAIELAGVRTHSLQGVDVRLPHGALSVIAGVSGSGKSSLAFATLAAEAQRRFAESLPFQVRRQLERLPRPVLDAARGLTPTLALDQRTPGARGGRRSTVGTQSGLGPLLRLLASRAGRRDGAPTGLSAAHFSPDQVWGACPACEGQGTVARCDPARLIQHPERSLYAGAMDGSKPGEFFGEPDGKTLATLAAALPEVDLRQPWSALPARAQEVALRGAGDAVFEVAWAFKRGAREGEHSFRSAWDGLCALVEAEARKRAGRKHGAAWAAPLVEAPCPACQGARLAPAPRETDLGGSTLPALLELPLVELGPALAALAGPDPEARAALDALRPELQARIEDLVGLGLGHLSLARRSPTLSDGELQRVRLASVLRAELTGVTLVLDEPGSGLHARDLRALVAALEAWQAAGNTCVVVSHRPTLLRAAQWLVELGPGAGPAGGRLVAQGPAADVLAGETLTARALRASAPPSSAPPAAERLEVEGASAHTLRDLDLSLPASGFVAVSGVSGAGKSSLVFAAIGASLEAGAPRGCRALRGFERFVAVRSARAPSQSPSVLGALDLAQALSALFGAAAKQAGSPLPARAFSFNSPAGRCPTCNGSGRETVVLDGLQDLALPCPACAGARYRPEVLEVRWAERTVADVLALPAQALRPLLSAARLPTKARPLLAATEALERVALGHLSLGRPTAELSGGERQRLLLAAGLRAPQSPTLYLLEEPGLGLHEDDLRRLAELFRELGAQGDLVLATVHRLSLLRAADEVLDLGPGGGPAGGQLVAQGPPAALREGATAEALRA